MEAPLPATVGTVSSRRRSNSVRNAVPWRRIGKGLAIAMASLLGVLLLLFLVLYVTKGRFLKEPATSLASRVTGRTVTVGGDFQLYLDPHVRLRTEHLSISNPGWVGPAAGRDDALFRAERLDASIRVLPLFVGDVKFRRLDLVRGNANLVRDERGRASWDFDGKETGAPFRMPDIRAAQVVDSRLRFDDRKQDLSVDLNIGDVDVEENAVDQPLTAQGTGRSRGLPFRLDARWQGRSGELMNGPQDLTLAVDVAGSRVEVRGQVAGTTTLDGVEFNVFSRGRTLAAPFRLIGIVVPDTRTYTVRGIARKDGDTWRVRDLKGRFGDSDLAGTLAVHTPGETGEGRLKLEADLSSQMLDIIDVGPWIGYNPERLDAQGGRGAITQEGGRPWLLPNATLATEALGNFDAEVRYRAGRVRTGNVPINDLDLTLSLDHRLLRLNPVAINLAGGRLTAYVNIDARQETVTTDYDLRLSPAPLSRLLASFGALADGTTGTLQGRMQLRGYGDTVRKSLGSSHGRIALILPKGTLWVRNNELVELDIGGFIEAAISDDLKKPAEIHCGLIGFTVKDGQAVADPVLIDTERAVIRGRGGFTFKDESLGLQIEADSKKVSLFSAQSPISLQGYFAAPAINPISPELLARGGAGAALSAVATPLAAILAFLDVGDAEDTNCGPVLEGASAAKVKAAQADGKQAAKAAEKQREAAETQAKRAREAAEEAEEKRREAAEDAQERAEKQAEKAR